MNKSWRLVVVEANGAEIHYHFEEEPRLISAKGFTCDLDANSVISYVGKAASGGAGEVYIVLRNVVAWYVQEVEEE